MYVYEVCICLTRTAAAQQAKHLPGTGSEEPTAHLTSRPCATRCASASCSMRSSTCAACGLRPLALARWRWLCGGGTGRSRYWAVAAECVACCSLWVLECEWRLSERLGQGRAKSIVAVRLHALGSSPHLRPACSLPRSDHAGHAAMPAQAAAQYGPPGFPRASQPASAYGSGAVAAPPMSHARTSGVLHSPPSEPHASHIHALQRICHMNRIAVARSKCKGWTLLTTLMLDSLLGPASAASASESELMVAALNANAGKPK
jgi:hypothetical protein